MMDIDKKKADSWEAGFKAGKDPATPYGIRAPAGLDSLAFAAGLGEGRVEAYKIRARERERALDLFL
jgi:hypothetical protein